MFFALPQKEHYNKAHTIYNKEYTLNTYTENKAGQRLQRKTERLGEAVPAKT